MLRDNLEGWDRVGGQGDVQEGEDVCILVADSLLYGRSQHNIVKQLPSN